MKPEGAMELATPADFSFASFADAHQMAIEKLFPKGMNLSYGTVIKVASQGMAEAIALSYASGGRVEIDFGYAHDEWSVTVNYYDILNGRVNHKEETVWSGGA